MENQHHNNKYRVLGTRPIRHDGEDKVTGRAKYGADMQFPDLLHGKVLRSPHSHARILSVDTSAAERMEGVKGIVTAADLFQQENKVVESGETTENMRLVSDRLLASKKVLFIGHPIAAVAATDPWIAEEACKAIKVEYELLRPVIDVLDAMAPDAPLLHENLTKGAMGNLDPRFAKVKDQTPINTNAVNHVQNKFGDVEAGFAEADVVVEREFRTATVHQGYIEPQTATALAHSDGQITIWVSTQGHFAVRQMTASLLQVPLSSIKVVPMEIGGGFGGKTAIYLEPVSALLSQKTGRPVKTTMSRSEVFQATGPASATVTRFKIGARKDGKITALQTWMAYESGAYPGGWSTPAAKCVFAPYKTENLLIDVYDVVTNTTKVIAYRAPSSPQAMFGTESVIDELAETLGIDPLEFRLMNANKEGDKQADGTIFPRIGLVETLEAIKNSAHWKSPAPSGPNQGRGLATGFWQNGGMQSSATVTLNSDGTANVITGSVDIGGSRASMAMITAEVLGLEATDVRPQVADTDSIGHTDTTGGSRVTFATGKVVHDAAQDAVTQLKERAAMIWDMQPQDVAFTDGVLTSTKDASKTMTIREIAPKLTPTGGPVQGRSSWNATGVGPGYGVHLADVEIDPETGKLTVLRYTAAQDVGTAIHPDYVEGQIAGGVAQGMGWALNEEYVRDEKGNMLNAGFLDYRMPTFLDVPEFEIISVEVPNPVHPYGVRGVGEVPIVPPLGAFHNAIYHAIGVRMRSLPMSPPKISAALEEKSS